MSDPALSADARHCFVPDSRALTSVRVATLAR